MALVDYDWYQISKEQRVAFEQLAFERAANQIAHVADCWALALASHPTLGITAAVALERFASALRNTNCAQALMEETVSIDQLSPSAH